MDVTHCGTQLFKEIIVCLSPSLSFVRQRFCIISGI